MKISNKFQFDLIYILEGLERAVYKPDSFAKLNELEIQKKYTKELKMKLRLNELSKKIEELMLVLSFCEKDAEKNFYNKVLVNCEELIRYLYLNKGEWFETDIYAICSDGQDRVNKKYVLWKEIEKLAKVSSAEEAY